MNHDQKSIFPKQWPLAGEFVEFEYSPKIRQFVEFEYSPKWPFWRVWPDSIHSPDIRPTFANPFARTRYIRQTFASPFSGLDTFARHSPTLFPGLDTFAKGKFTRI